MIEDGALVRNYTCWIEDPFHVFGVFPRPFQRTWRSFPYRRTQYINQVNPAYAEQKMLGYTMEMYRAILSAFAKLAATMKGTDRVD